MSTSDFNGKTLQRLNIYLVLEQKRCRGPSHEVRSAIRDGRS